MAHSCPSPSSLPNADTVSGRALDARQRGQGTVEFLLAATPVLLLALSSIEAIHWYFSRQAVSLALIQAARAATTQHADPAVLDQAFSRALLPMHAGPTPDVTRLRLQRAMTRREHDTGLPAWRIRILSPSTASFNDFNSRSPDLPQTGKLVIDNDYLHEQHQHRLNQGQPDGRSPVSGQNPLEANTLILHLTWLHEPLLPGMKQLLKQIAPRDQRYGSQAMASAGYLPLQRRVALVMQSHAIAWEMPPHGRITRASHAGAAEEDDTGTKSLIDSEHSPDPDQAGPQPCKGLWCLQDYVGGQAPGNGGQHGVETPADSDAHADAGSGEHYEDGYLGTDPDDADASTPPEMFDDCPGCCD